MSDLLEVDIRKPAVAGSFYPDSPSELRSLIDSLIQNSRAEPVTEPVLGLVCPHAGYAFSGMVAASAYKQLRGRTYDMVVVISPSHDSSFRGCTTLAKAAYETPLGVIDAAYDEAGHLADICEYVELNWIGHRREHAIEVQLPFLQRMLPKFRLLPVVMGEQSFEVASRLGECLGQIADGKSCLVIASSDLSHYRNYNDAVSIDSRTMEVISAFDALAFEERMVEKKIEACGRGPIIATIIAAKALGAKHIVQLDYMNSGDITGRTACVVGYGAAALY
jgi:AmmeMemoRadiSam system protein B